MYSITGELIDRSEVRMYRSLYGAFKIKVECYADCFTAISKYYTAIVCDGVLE